MILSPDVDTEERPHAIQYVVGFYKDTTGPSSGQAALSYIKATGLIYNYKLGGEKTYREKELEVVIASLFIILMSSVTCNRLSNNPPCCVLYQLLLLRIADILKVNFRKIC